MNKVAKAFVLLVEVEDSPKSDCKRYASGDSSSTDDIKKAMIFRDKYAALTQAENMTEAMSSLPFTVIYKVREVDIRDLF